MQREDPKGQPDRCEKTDHTQNCEFIFENYPGSDIQINLFQALGDYLLWLGMTTELQKPRTVPFERGQSINVRFVGAPGPDKKGKPPTAEVVGPPGGSPLRARRKRRQKPIGSVSHRAFMQTLVSRFLMRHTRRTRRKQPSRGTVPIDAARRDGGNRDVNRIARQFGGRRPQCHPAIHGR